jgi:hypothetical protein
LSELIVINEQRNVRLSKPTSTRYLYQIGSDGFSDNSATYVNDAKRLQQIALEIRDEYSEFIYSLNDQFGASFDGSLSGSVFLLSDCSAKRTEIFNTFGLICNLLLLREIIATHRPSQIMVYGGDRQFCEALIKIAGPVPLKINIQNKGRIPQQIRLVISDLRFILQVALIVFLKSLWNSSDAPPTHRKRAFFTIFPKMTDAQGRDRKYGEFVKSEDFVVASIIADGLHQHVSVREFFRHRATARKYGFGIIDDYLQHGDWIRGARSLLPFRGIFRKKPVCAEFRGVEIGGWIQQELQQSASRLTRFSIIKGPFARFFQDYQIRELVYYLHEYPLGRLISLILSVEQPQIRKIGYQHGPASWSKMLYFMSPAETHIAPRYHRHVPIPDAVFAEDNNSAKIYEYSGYCNVQVLKKIWRIKYLDDIKPAKRESMWLIAPGLHDGEAMLLALSSVFASHPEKTIIVKPHPLANQNYISRISPNLRVTVTFESLPELLTKVGAVFVTYSSVGSEALSLGIPVYLVHIPGIVNESPLADIKPEGGWIMCD